MRRYTKIVLCGLALSALLVGVAPADDGCVDCHKTISPGQVKDWSVSMHATAGVTCSDCHDGHGQASRSPLQGGSGYPYGDRIPETAGCHGQNIRAERRRKQDCVTGD